MGVGLSTERWYGCGMVMVVFQSQDRNLALEWEWGGMGVGMVLKLDQLLIYIFEMLMHRKPGLIGSFRLYPTCIQVPQSNAHRVGVASTNRTDKFWHTGSAKEYSSEEFDD